MCYLVGMERIGVRELRQHATRYLGRVKAGETVEVTERGQLVALLVPPAPGATERERLIAMGQLVPASRPFRFLAARRCRPRGRAPARCWTISRRANVIYLDSSALLKLLHDEAESAAWPTGRRHARETAREQRARKVEVVRACRRINPTTLTEAAALLAGLDLIPLSGAVMKPPTSARRRCAASTRSTSRARSRSKPSSPPSSPTTTASPRQRRPPAQPLAPAPDQAAVLHRETALCPPLPPGAQVRELDRAVVRGPLLDGSRIAFHAASGLSGAFFSIIATRGGTVSLIIATNSSADSHSKLTSVSSTSTSEKPPASSPVRQEPPASGATAARAFPAGADYAERAIAVPIGTAMNGTRSGGPHEADHHPRTRNEEAPHPASGGSASGSKMIPKRDSAA